MTGGRRVETQQFRQSAILVVVSRPQHGLRTESVTNSHVRHSLFMSTCSRTATEYLKDLKHVVTSSPIAKRSIVASVYAWQCLYVGVGSSVCVSAIISQKPRVLLMLCIAVPTMLLGPPLVMVQRVTDFRFCG